MKDQVRLTRSGRWRVVVLLGVHLLIAVHLVHWRATGSTLSPLEPSEAMEFSKHGIINAGFVFFVLSILGTLVFGRFFCGWGCHLVALQDLCRWLLLKVGLRPRPLRSRLLLFVPPLAFAYMFLWPLVYRIWIGDDLGLRGTEMVKEDFWATMPSWPVGLLTFAVCGFATVYILGSKGFCTYGCPYGAIFGVVDRLAPGRIRVTDACDGSAACTVACSSNVLVHKEVAEYGMVVDPGCMKCMDCVSSCPNGALYFGFGRPATGAPARKEPKTRRPRFSLREEFLLGLLFLGAFLTFRGLYGIIPFLLSLGLAAILAALGLITLRLFTTPAAQLPPFTLKEGGRITRAGWSYLCAVAPLLVFWAHSALVRHHETGLAAFHEETAAQRASWFEAGAGPRASGDEAAALSAAGHAEFLDRWALSVSPHERFQGTWARTLAGEDAGFGDDLAALVSGGRGSAEVCWALAEVRRSEQRGEESLALFRAALERDPGHLRSHVALGRMLASTGDLTGALSAFDSGLEHHPHHPVLQYNRGTALVLAGDAPGAEASYRQVLDLDPLFHRARENLAGLLCSQGRTEEGLALYEEALQYTDDAAGLLVYMALARAQSGDLAGAEADLLRALELEPARADALELLSVVRSSASPGEGLDLPR